MKNEQSIKVNEALMCENATSNKCTCQCGGKFHGARRGSIGNLPVNDPHSPSSRCPLCGGAGKVQRYREGKFIEAICPACHETGLVVLPKTIKIIDRAEA